VNFGIEAQIDDLARNDGADIHRTGAIYGVADPAFARQSCQAPGRWNDYEITCVGQTYTVMLNGVQTTHVVNADPGRGAQGTPAAPAFLGLQAHSGRVLFRHIAPALDSQPMSFIQSGSLASCARDAQALPHRP
jgi:hypothetical protein